MPRYSSHTALNLRDVVCYQTPVWLTSPSYVVTRSILADQDVLATAVAEHCNTHLVNIFKEIVRHFGKFSYSLSRKEEERHLILWHHKVFGSKSLVKYSASTSVMWKLEASSAHTENGHLFFLRGRWNKCLFKHLIAFKNFFVCLSIA